MKKNNIPTLLNDEQRLNKLKHINQNLSDYISILKEKNVNLKKGVDNKKIENLRKDLKLMI